MSRDPNMEESATRRCVGRASLAEGIARCEGHEARPCPNCWRYIILESAKTQVDG